MLQYVNGFSCAMDSEKDEMIIKLLQRSPDFTDDNDGVIMDEVTTIVMGKVTAQRLLEGLREMLEDEDELQAVYKVFEQMLEDVDFEM